MGPPQARPWRPGRSSGCTSRRQTANGARSGIPVIVDRVLQARVVNALEPEWEARFEPRSYGFRPGRGCHDAIEAIFQVAKGANPARRWVLDADLAAAFDRIDHHQLLDSSATFPARERIAGWLKAGVVEHGPVHPDRGGNSSRRGGQPVAVERRAARDGARRRGPLRPHRPAVPLRRAGAARC